MPALAQLLEPLRVVRDPLARDPQLLGDVVELGLGRAHPRVELGERRPTGERVDRVAERVETGTFDRVVGARQRVAVRGRVGEQGLLLLEPRLFVDVVDGGGGDLVHLEPEEVDLACSGAFVATQRGEVSGDGACFGARGAVRSQCTQCWLPRVPVERAALHRGIQQRLVRVLAVQVDETRAALRELADRRQPAVDVRATPAVTRDDARQHDLGRRVGRDVGVGVDGGVDEAPFDAGLGRAVAHERHVGAPAHQELERLHEERLARTGLAGDGGEPGPEDQVEVGDDAEVDDVQFEQHGVSGRRGRTWPSGSGGSRGARG